MKAIIEKISRKFEDFAAELRDITDDLPQDRNAGYGEEPDKPEGRNAGYGEKRGQPAELYVKQDGQVGLVQAQARNGLDDDSVITMKSRDLRQVVDAYRKLSRYAREGRIPTQEERFKLHQSVKAVKHLIRGPRH